MNAANAFILSKTRKTFREALEEFDASRSSGDAAIDWKEMNRHQRLRLP
jgi:hypothetical protein